MEIRCSRSSYVISVSERGGGNGRMLWALKEISAGVGRVEFMCPFVTVRPFHGPQLGHRK